MDHSDVSLRDMKANNLVALLSKKKTFTMSLKPLNSLKKGLVKISKQIKDLRIWQRHLMWKSIKRTNYTLNNNLDGMGKDGTEYRTYDFPVPAVLCHVICSQACSYHPVDVGSDHFPSVILQKGYDNELSFQKNLTRNSPHFSLPNLEYCSKAHQPQINGSLGHTAGP